MTPYIVSARKYRPDTFESLIGQDNIARTLKNSIIRGQLAHAYLFCGPRGVGKTTTARIFAKAINCSNPSSDMEPCGECESCRSFAEGRSYCIHELDAASNNGVEDIKTLMDQVRIPPQVGQYSVYIIDEVHMLSQAAFNAFLKTLEEPPAHAIFILATTEKHKILPTILSRCQTYDFNRISVEDIVRQLRTIAQKENITVDDESLHVIAVKADGAMRDALTIFDQTVAFCGTEIQYKDVLKNLNVLDYEYSFSLVDAFLAGDCPKALLTFDEILSKGFNALHFVAALSSHFRDLVVSKSGALDALLELPASLKQKYHEQSARCPLPFLYEALGITTACESSYKASINPRLHIEFALMRLCTIGSAQPASPSMTTVTTPSGNATAAGNTPSGNVTAARNTPSGNVNPASQPRVGASSASGPATGTAPTAAAGNVATGTAPAAPAGNTSGPATGTAPAPAGGNAEEEKPARRVRKTVAGLSLKKMTEEKETQAVAEAGSPAGELTAENLPEKWKELAALYSAQPRLASALGAATLSLSEENGQKTVSFKVFNKAQKEWIESRRLHELEGHFQRITGTDARLAVDYAEEDDGSPKVAYLPTEKAQELMSRNEEVKNLVKDFGLDIR